MGKLSATADRMRELKVRLEQKADALNKKMDAADTTEKAAFERAHKFLEEQGREVDEIEKTITQLTNLPLDGSGKSPAG